MTALKSGTALKSDVSYDKDIDRKSICSWFLYLDVLFPNISP